MFGILASVLVSVIENWKLMNVWAIFLTHAWKTDFCCLHDIYLYWSFHFVNNDYYWSSINHQPKNKTYYCINNTIRWQTIIKRDKLISKFIVIIISINGLDFENMKLEKNQEKIFSFITLNIKYHFHEVNV